MAGPLLIGAALANGAIQGIGLGQNQQKLDILKQQAADAHMQSLAGDYLKGLQQGTDANGNPTISASPGALDPTNPQYKLGELTADRSSFMRAAPSDYSSLIGDPRFADLGLGDGTNGTVDAKRIQKGSAIENAINSRLSPNPKATMLDSQQLDDYQNGRIARDANGNPVSIPPEYVKAGGKQANTLTRLGDWASAMGHQLPPDANPDMMVDPSTARAMIGGWKPPKPTPTLTPDQINDYEKNNGAGSSTNLTPGGYFNWKNAQARATTAAGNFDITRGDAEAGKLNALASPIQKIQAGLEGTRTIYDFADNPNKLDEGTLAAMKSVVPFLGVQGMRAYNSIMKMQQGSGSTLAGDVNKFTNYLGLSQTSEPTSASPEMIAAYRDSAIKMADDLQNKLSSAKADFNSKAPTTAQNMAKNGTLSDIVPNYYRGADAALTDMQQRKADWIKNPRSGLNRSAPQSTGQSIQSAVPGAAPQTPGAAAVDPVRNYMNKLFGVNGNRSPQSLPSDGMDDSTTNMGTGGGAPPPAAALIPPAPVPQASPSEIRANRTMEPQLIGQAQQAVEQARQNLLRTMGTSPKGSRQTLGSAAEKMDAVKQQILDRLSASLGRDVYEHEIDNAPTTGNGPRRGHDPMFGGH